MSLLSHALASRWVAGETIDSVIHAAKISNMHGLKTMIHYLGENYRDEQKVGKTVNTYLHLMEHLLREHVISDISVKPTQLGLSLGKGYCLRNLATILDYFPQTVWIDVESPDQIQDTIDIYLGALKHYDNIAIALEADMRRTRKDLLEILKAGGRVRLVKGACKGFFSDEGAIEFNFSRLMRLLFRKSENFAIATNDKELIAEATHLQYRYNKKFEFQFLRGMSRGMKKNLVYKGYSVRDYIPFGKDALPYAWRRFRKDKSMLFRIMR